MNRKLTATLLILAAALATAGFAALGSIFNYPDVLDEPAGKVLAAFRDSESVISTWFAVLALSAALLAPIAIGVGRLSSKRVMRIAVPVGIAAAVVQVIGLLRWPLLVPGYAADAASKTPDTASSARDTFTTVSDILGTGLGETVGYLLTAVWTTLVIVALERRYAGRWFQLLGLASAGLVFVGVFSPLDLPLVDAANFVGYVLWSAWLVAFGVCILVRERGRGGPVNASSGDRVKHGDVSLNHQGSGGVMQVKDQSLVVPKTPTRVLLRWLVTFIGFPLGGLAAELIVGPVDSVVAALAGGALTGAIIGAVQAWGLRPSGVMPEAWIAATAAGLGVGLALGASAVGFGTSLGDLAIQGAVSGLVMGLAQAVVLRPKLGSIAFVWAPALGTLWTIGWAITTASGVDVESQYTVFGSSGAVIVTLATATLPIWLTLRAGRSTT